MVNKMWSFALRANQSMLVSTRGQGGGVSLQRGTQLMKATRELARTLAEPLRDILEQTTCDEV